MFLGLDQFTDLTLNISGTPGFNFNYSVQLEKPREGKINFTSKFLWPNTLTEVFRYHNTLVCQGPSGWKNLKNSGSGLRVGGYSIIKNDLMWNHKLPRQKFLSCFLTMSGANQFSLFWSFPSPHLSTLFSPLSPMLQITIEIN